MPILRKLLVILFLCLPQLLQAQSDSLPVSRKAPWYVLKYSISFGSFFPVNNTNVKVEGTNGRIGTDIDFENDLGFKRNTFTMQGGIQWRASRRSRFDLSIFGVSRNVYYTLQKDITFKEHTYPVDADISAYFNTGIYRFSYGYAFVCNEKAELGAMVGLHVIDTEVGMGLHSTDISANYSDNVGVTAPLPDLGIWGGYAFNKKWAFTGETNYLSAKIGNIDGRLFNYNFVIRYRITPRIHAAAGYGGFHFTVTDNREKLNGTLKWGYNGPSVMLLYNFGFPHW